MEKKTIVARAEVLPGKEQEFISKAEPLIQGTRAEEGNISYILPILQHLFFMRSTKTKMP